MAPLTNMRYVSGACLGQHLGHIVNDGQQSAMLHASVMPFFKRIASLNVVAGLRSPQALNICWLEIFKRAQEKLCSLNKSSPNSALFACKVGRVSNRCYIAL